MYTERYLPKKYRDSRRRRRRNRLKRILIIVALVAALAVGGYFLVRWLAGGSRGPAAIPTPNPSTVYSEVTITPTDSFLPLDTPLASAEPSETAPANTAEISPSPSPAAT